MSIDNVREDGSVDTDFGEYCRHGKYIGTPGGADFMCGFCEEGWTDEEYAEYVRERMDERVRKALRDAYLRECIPSLRTFSHVWGRNPEPDPMMAAFNTALREINELNHDELTELCVESLGWVRT